MSPQTKNEHSTLRLSKVIVHTERMMLPEKLLRLKMQTNLIHLKYRLQVLLPSSIENPY